MLSDRCLSVCPVCLSVCDVRALWPNGWTDQDETWRAGRPRPWSHCVRWDHGDPAVPAPPPPKGHSPYLIFGPCLLRPNGCMDEDGTWHGGRPWSSPYCAMWEHGSPPKKGSEPPNFGSIFIVAKRLDASRIKVPHGMEVGLSPGDFVADGDPVPKPQKGRSPTQFSAHVYCDQTAAWIKMRLHESRCDLVRR